MFTKTDTYVEASRDSFTSQSAGQDEEERVQEEHERGVLEPVDGFRVREGVILQDREDDHSADLEGENPWF